jgi:hypothetical protein
MSRPFIYSEFLSESQKQFEMNNSQSKNEYRLCAHLVENFSLSLQSPDFSLSWQFLPKNFFLGGNSDFWPAYTAFQNNPCLRSLLIATVQLQKIMYNCNMPRSNDLIHFEDQTIFRKIKKFFIRSWKYKIFWHNCGQISSSLFKNLYHNFLSSKVIEISTHNIFAVQKLIFFGCHDFNKSQWFTNQKTIFRPKNRELEKNVSISNFRDFVLSFLSNRRATWPTVQIRTVNREQSTRVNRCTRTRHKTI